MKVQTVSIDMEAFGAAFANLDSKEQGAFFHGLAQELKRFESHYSAQLQFGYIAQEITEGDKAILEDVLCMLEPKKV